MKTSATTGRCTAAIARDTATLRTLFSTRTIKLKGWPASFPQTPVPVISRMVSTLPSSSSARTSGTLSEQFVQDSFHSYLKSSLTQAKAERLLDDDLLSSAEGDLMITGPALCLYFAALRCTTYPPSVPLPRGKGSNKAPMDLSPENCPPAFTSFLRVWANCVPFIQELLPEYQHDLARVICGLDPLCQPLNISLNGIAADLRGVAIEISQRRSFQDRYAADLQAALDADIGGRPTPKRASFVPPPVYAPSSSSHSIPSSPHSSRASLEVPPPPLPPRKSLELPTQSPNRRSPSPISPGSSTSSFSRSPSSPSLFTFDSPAIEFIRETLYASLGDQLERTPSLRRLLKRDPPRAYFAAVAFAILDVATNSITPDGEVIGVVGKRLTLDECPPQLRPFMTELVGIGRAATEMEEADTEAAIKLASQGKVVPPSKLDRVKKMLEGGIGVERGTTDGRSSVEGRAVAFSNRINSLSLSMTKLKAFRERQDYVFKILAGIGS